MTAVIAFIFALLAACGVPSGAPEQPDKKPPEEIQEGQHYCCFSVGVTQAGKGTGDGCVTAGAGNIDSCDKVLYCNGDWLKDDGKVTCL